MLVLMGFAGLLGACGGDYCSNMEQVASNSAQRTGSCGGDTSITVNFSQSACENALSSNSCSGSDRSALAQASSCLDSLPQCTPDTETTFLGDVISCEGDAQSVSGSCNTALLEAGAPIVSLNFSGSCASTGDACSKNGDCCSNDCGASDVCD
jgi:hypothetical protein